MMQEFVYGCLPLFLNTIDSVALHYLYFDSFLLICSSFVLRARGTVCALYLLCQRCEIYYSKHERLCFTTFPNIEES